MYLRGSTDGWFEDLRSDGYYYPANHDITQICVHCRTRARHGGTPGFGPSGFAPAGRARRPRPARE